MSVILSGGSVLTRALLCGLLLPAIVRHASAQQEPPRRVSPSRPVRTPTAEIQPAGAPAARGLRDRAELEAFMDGVMVAQLRDHHVAGATVSVVKDGALFFAKGYGSSDVRQQRPVAAESTMFRVGSISKLFTWTAVMQLVEQGKLDLNTDINTYLDFKIPATFPQPITLTNVMTHTPGLEEDPRDLFTEDSSHITPMGKWLPGAHAEARASAGHVRVVLQLGDSDRRLHRRARERHAVRHLRREEHPRAVRHERRRPRASRCRRNSPRRCRTATSGKAVLSSRTNGRSSPAGGPPVPCRPRPRTWRSS